MTSHQIDYQKQLAALTHLDGRNFPKLTQLADYFSEYNWMKHRLEVMVLYIINLAAFLGKPVSITQKSQLSAIVQDFTTTEAEIVISVYERKVNHDLKAIEMFLSEQIKRKRLNQLNRFVNLAIGSEDINNIAFYSNLLFVQNDILKPLFTDIIKLLIELSESEKSTLMVGRTHAQAANITTYGKETANFLNRITVLYHEINTFKFKAKLSGEVGSMQSFSVLGPEMDWFGFTRNFLKEFNLDINFAATQINPYDHLCSYLQMLFRLNTVLINLATDQWMYVLLGYLKVKAVNTEAGSAGMPHKVNPIYFEGAEGGLKMANGMIEVLCRELPVNRLQRGFADSTLRRNISSVYGLCVLSYQSIIEAFKRTTVDHGAISHDLKKHPEITIEAIRVIGQYYNVPDIYNLLKEQTRGKIVSQTDLEKIVKGLSLPNSQKQKLIEFINNPVSPLAIKLTQKIIDLAKQELNS